MSLFRLGHEVDPAAVLLDDVVGDPESQAGPYPLGLGREEGVEDLASDRLGDAWAVVDHLVLDLVGFGEGASPYDDRRPESTAWMAFMIRLRST